MTSPSISVMNCGSAFSAASHVRRLHRIELGLDGRDVGERRLRDFDDEVGAATHEVDTR
jgi:hypothetical protein